MAFELNQMTAPRGSLVGHVLDGKFRIVRHIADGGMGAVYEAENQLIGKRVAIKALHPEFLKNEDIISRFHKEARAASAIGHEHIVDISDMGRMPDGSVFMVMELLVGRNLGEMLAKEGALPPWRASAVLMQVLDALESAHRHGIIHRDLKPENIFLLDRTSHPDFVKVLDFGISKILTDQPGIALTTTGVIAGTPYYMAPELARGGAFDHRLDIYACGAILYQMVTGRLPFNAPNFNALLFEIAAGRYLPPRAIVPDIPPVFEQVIRHAMALDPQYRYQTAADFRAALAPFANQGRRRRPGFTIDPDTGRTSVVGGGAGATRPEPRRLSRIQIVGAGAAIGVLMGGVLVTMLHMGRPGPVTSANAPLPSEPMAEAPPPVEEPAKVEPPPVVAPEPPPPARVTVRFTIEPPEAATEAVISVAGEEVSGMSTEVERPEDARVQVIVRSPGWAPFRKNVELAADGSETLVPVVLRRAAAPKKRDPKPGSGPGGSIDL